jgi:NADH:ubiquinone oxidoreductase subunit
MKKLWTASVLAVFAMAVSPHAEGGTLIEDFSGSLANWTIYSQNSTVGITTSPYSDSNTGPGGSCVQLCMGGQADKLAYMTLNSRMWYKGTETVTLSFDLGYNRIDKNGWYHGLSLLNSTGATMVWAGHTGYRGASAGGTPNQDSFLFNVSGTQELSPTGVAHPRYGWCHYVVELAPTGTTLTVYSWISNNPADYAVETPVWQTTLGALPEGLYTLALVNHNTAIDTYTQIRDFMYVTNVYIDMPSMMTTTPIFSPVGSYILGPTPITISCADENAAIYYTTDNSNPTTESTQYTSHVMVDAGMTLKAIAVSANQSCMATIKSVSYIIAENSLIDDFSGDLSKWTVYSQNSTVGITTSPYTGPGGSCVQLCMGGKANKLAYMTLNPRLKFDTDETVIVSFDMAYNRIDIHGWYHGISLLDGAGETKVRVGHTGYRGAYAGGTPNQDSFYFTVGNAQDLSPTGVVHPRYGWCHYVLELMPTATTMRAYTWVSSNPVDYSAETPLWESTMPALSEGVYALALVNTNTTIDSYTQIRDFMYVTNVYLGMADVTTTTPIFQPEGNIIQGPTPITISCSNEVAAIYYTIDGTDPTVSGILYTDPVEVNGDVTLKAIAVVEGLSSLAEIKSVTYELESYNRPETIPYGSAVVDGDLTDWAQATWTPLDVLSDVNITEETLSVDVPEAFYAARWQANKVYLAVKVRDTGRHFSDTYDAWDARDAVEIFLHTAEAGSVVDYTPNNTIAQQYAVGIKTSNTNSTWAMVGPNGALDLTGHSDVADVAGKVVGDWIQYEIAMTPFDYLGIIETGNMNTSVISELVMNQVIGLDVDVVSTNSNGTYLGKRSENDLAPKYNNWKNFGLHKLGEAVSRILGDANGDRMVDVGDLGILAANYGGTGKSWKEGDFNGDGLVDVGDLGILAANYGTNASSADWSTDYAKTFGATITDGDNAEDTSGSVCGSLGLPLVAGLMLMGLLLVKVEE